MSDNDTYVIRAGSTAHDQYETDVTPELATPGAFAVYPYVSGSATTVPVAYAIDDLRVEPVAP